MPGHFQPLTQTVSHLDGDYDVSVIGSGYGAGVAAARLSGMGLRVCVLERGREFLPGDFPNTLGAGMQQFQSTSKLGHVGNHDALFDMRVDSDVSVLVGCGVGGTSLINGNVMLEPEARVFDDHAWPKAIRDGLKSEMADGYKLAREMLQPVSYSGTPGLAKTDALKKSADAIGGAFSFPPINVTFKSNGKTNAGGVQQADCTLCGDCCSGCNIGAKNTVAMNYLPKAVQNGAEIFTGAKVSHVEKASASWKVVYDDMQTGETRSIFVTNVVIGAGTLGSSEIMLRSKAAGLSVSDRAGEKFSGNGDVLAFGYNNDLPINGIGMGALPVDPKKPVGPVIAGLVDLRNRPQLKDGMVIQEGAIPGLLAPLLPAMMASGAPLFGDDTDSGDTIAEFIRSAKSVFKGAYEGAVHNTQTFLVMAHDGAKGKMQLRDERMVINWPDAGHAPVYQKISEVLNKATAATGGTFIDNPLWSRMLGRNLVSVHPLGGCVLGEDVDVGVIDDRSRVFKGDGGVWDGLYVMDGSIIPRSLGVNPSLTITALAERAMVLFGQNRQVG